MAKGERPRPADVRGLAWSDALAAHTVSPPARTVLDSGDASSRMVPLVVKSGGPSRHAAARPYARPLLTRRFGLVPYHAAVQSMRARTDVRGVDSPDELWLLEHPPVFTLGRAGRRSHVRDPGAIPVVRTDRGGQVTYHGPGQLVAYLLLDLQRAKIGVRQIVETLEQATIDMLSEVSVVAARREGAPGVYVEGRKIASVGLRVRAGRTFHGISINVDHDLSPFNRIDPCGFAELPVSCIADLMVGWSVGETGCRLAASLGRALGRSIEWEEKCDASLRGLAGTEESLKSIDIESRRRKS